MNLETVENVAKSYSRQFSRSCPKSNLNILRSRQVIFSDFARSGYVVVGDYDLHRNNSDSRT
jgi:hypothetical protein